MTESTKSVSSQIQHLDHVGYNPINLDTFEEFWCLVLGFTRCWESSMEPEMAWELFGAQLSQPIRLYRYKHPEIQTQIEVHMFPHVHRPASFPFAAPGISHICLHVEDRLKFIDSLPDTVTKIVYDNPKGWKNIFIQDYEGNWIELREKL